MMFASNRPTQTGIACVDRISGQGCCFNEKVGRQVDARLMQSPGQLVEVMRESKCQAATLVNGFDGELSRLLSVKSTVLPKLAGELAATRCQQMAVGPREPMLR